MKPPLTSLKLSENEKTQLLNRQEAQRKNAIYSIFSSFGSVLTGASPIQIAYVIANAGLNYARAVNDININTSDAEFQIGQQELTSIDRLRSSLFISSAKVFSGRTSTTTGLIGEEEMKDFARMAIIVDQGGKEEISTIIPILQNKENNFSSFAPFWATLGRAYMKLEMHSFALECFDKFEQLMEGNHIFNNNPHYLVVAKEKIVILLQQESKDFESISHYIQLVIDNTPKVQQHLDDLYYFLAPVYAYINNDAKALSAMNYLVSQGIEKAPKEGLFATYISSNYDKTTEGVKSWLFAAVIDNISFGFTDEVKEFFDRMNINPKHAVFCISTYPLMTATLKGSKKGSTNVIYHSYDLRDSMKRKIYVFDKVTWGNVLADEVSLIIDFGIGNHSVGIEYKFSNKEFSGSEFNQHIVVEPTFWQAIQPKFWKGKRDAYMTMSFNSME